VELCGGMIGTFYSTFHCLRFIPSSYSIQRYLNANLENSKA
jgi:hypothetical protein